MGFKIVFIFTEKIVISFSSAWWSADNCVSLPMYMPDKRTIYDEKFTN